MPIQLHVSATVDQMVTGWNESELEAGRRLVNLTVVRDSYANFHIDAQCISPHSYTPGDGRLVVSCIRWEEKDRHVVTSVDVILVLEYLVGEQFSIEEKSRIRRNLQFLKPSTVTRSNNESKRIFNSLMAMENPRPRNIEKDLKVFDWNELFVAVKKVLSKYSANPGASDPLIRPSMDHKDEQKNTLEVEPCVLSNQYPLRSVVPNSTCEPSRNTLEFTNSSASTRNASVSIQQPSVSVSINSFIDLPQHFISGSPSKCGPGSPRLQTKFVHNEQEPGPNCIRCNVPEHARPTQQQTIQV